MTDDASPEGAGDAAGGPVPPMPGFTIRNVPPPTTQESQARRDAMERAIRYGATAYRDAEGKARYVFFREANNAPVEAWRRDPKARHGFRRTQQARKAAGQLIWHPEDQIELAKRLGLIHYRESASPEGAAERGLHDAIWRYEHVYDSFTVPRRFGRDIMETGRIAAVAEEEGRKLQAEDPRAAGGFWVRDRKNNGLIYVVPNPNPDPEAARKGVDAALRSSTTTAEDDAFVGGEGADVAFGQADDASDAEATPAEIAAPIGAMDAEAADEQEEKPAPRYPNIPLPPLEASWKAAEDAAADGDESPVIDMEKDRIENILEDEPAVFEVEDWANADGSEPVYAIHEAGYWAVWICQDVIEYEATDAEIDPNLVKAIMYVENAQGWYGQIPQQFGQAKTLFPMNINPKTWGRLVRDGADFNDPIVNIKAGVRLIRRLYERIPTPTVAKVASPFKFTGMENVSDYGARVAEVYAARTWEERPHKYTEDFLRKTDPRNRVVLQRTVDQKVREKANLRKRLILQP